MSNRVRHPEFPDVVREVSAEELPDWLAAGWASVVEAETYLTADTTTTGTYFIPDTITTDNLATEGE